MKPLIEQSDWSETLKCGIKSIISQPLSYANGNTNICYLHVNSDGVATALGGGIVPSF